MLIGVIQVKDYITANHQICLIQHKVEAIELRLDYLKIFDIAIASELRKKFNLPMMFTLRKRAQGGLHTGKELQRLKDMLALCVLEPEYLDLEYTISKTFLEEVHARFPKIKLICSYHDFGKTPKELTQIFASMQHPFFYGYKIAAYANTVLDALRMMVFVKAHSEKYFLTGICMGEKGQLTRIMGPVVGSALNYVSENNKGTTAPGQLTCDESRKTYHYARLNKKTRIYALVGNPVHLSAGHILHNQAIQCLKQNAVYIKLCVEKENLAKIKAYCQQLAFYGFSITMPLKETILSLVDTIEKDSQTIHAVNSITCRRKKWYGFNTDGIGAIQALTEKINIENQLIVILGAGGAARAITYEALKRKAKVLILNRTYSRARQLADTLGCQAAKIERLKDIRSTACKVIINTLPQKAYTEKFMQDLLQPDYLAADLWMMDIVYRPSFTYFIKTAKAAGCRYIFGHDMYIYQALLQIKNWFDATEDQLNTIKSKMRYYFQ